VVVNIGFNLEFVKVLSQSGLDKIGILCMILRGEFVQASLTAIMRSF
jgi:hypothetical protein